jgi:hypothetical protein
MLELCQRATTAADEDLAFGSWNGFFPLSIKELTTELVFKSTE